MSEPCPKCGAGRVSCAHREYKPVELSPEVADLVERRKNNLPIPSVAKHGRKFQKAKWA